MRKVLVATLIFSCILYQSRSQVNFVASANKVVELGENFRLDFSVNANGTNFSPPDLSAFRVLAGPSTETSTNFEFINGKASQSISNKYSYIIQGKKEGKFTVGKAQITVDGKVYSTSPITIEIIKGNVPSTDQSNSDDFVASSKQNNNDIFIQINLNKNAVYQGEQVIATLKVYDRAGLKGINNYKFPSFSGFYSQEIKQPSQISLDRENVGGKIYNTGTLRQTILFPQKSGVLTIDPFELECIVQQKVGQRRNFFGDLVDVYDDVTKNLKSGSRSIKVLPLPPNAPSSFSGAVGSNFKFDVTVDRNQLKTNESITLKVVISGSGNLKILDKVKINFPASFEVFDPKISSNLSNTTAGSVGSNVYEYLIIPREAGEYTIPPLEFCYFDVISKSYKVFKSQELKFKIEKGTAAPNNTVVSSLNKEEVKELGTDIRFIYQDDFGLTKKDYTFFGSIGFYMFYLVSLFIFIVSCFILRKSIQRNKNLSLLKNKRANKVSQKRLKTAALCMKNGNKNEFYDEVIKALWGYLGDKLNIPTANLSRDTVRENLQKNLISDEIIEDFIKVIDNCEFAKYAPIAGNNQIEHDFESAKSIINKFEHVLS